MERDSAACLCFLRSEPQPNSAAMVSPGQEAVPFHMSTDLRKGSTLKQHGVPRKGGLVGVHCVTTWNLLQVWTVLL